MCFSLHFLLILAICCRSIFWVVGEGYSSLPASVAGVARKMENCAAFFLGDHLALAHPLRQARGAYSHLAGIETGYGFFAPNVPNSYKLVFELRYPNGQVDYALPTVGGEAIGVRLSALLNAIGRTQDETIRMSILKTLAYSVWQQHPEAVFIRAVFGVIILPSTSEAAKGGKESYESLYAYDFKFSPSN